MAVINNNEYIVKIILEYKPNLDCILNNPSHKFHGHNALHIAILKGNKTVIKALLEHGANPYAPINNLTSPYHDFNALNFFAFEKIKEMLDNGWIVNLPEGAVSAIVLLDGKAGPATPTVLFPDGSLVTITPIEYLKKIKADFKCDPRCYFIALIYIKRFLQFTNKDFTHDINICTDVISLDYKTFLAAMVVAVKWSDDTYFSNKFYAGVGLVSLAVLNKYELALLNTLNFEVFVSPEELNRLYAELIEFGKRPVASK